MSEYIHIERIKEMIEEEAPGFLLINELAILLSLVEEALETGDTTELEEWAR